MQIKERSSPKNRDFLLRNDKDDLKGFQTNFETLFLQVSATI